LLHVGKEPKIIPAVVSKYAAQLKNIWNEHDSLNTNKNENKNKNKEQWHFVNFVQNSVPFVVYKV
jgi:hypothetical protein